MEAREEIIRILEIPKILSDFSEFVRSPLGNLALKRLVPLTSLKALEERQGLLRSFMDYRDMFGEWPWNSRIVTVHEALSQAKRSGMLSGEDLSAVFRLLSLAMATREILLARREAFPLFELPGKRIRDFSPEIRELSVLDDNGNLYDSASPALSQIRRDLESIRRQVRRSAQSLLETPSIGQMLQERVLAFREGHFAFLVRQEFVNRFPGMFVDRSSSGNSVYMEPSALVPLNSRLKLRMRDEEEEVQSILRKLTGAILTRERPILEAEAVLGDLDLLYAASEVMSKKKWKIPQTSDKTFFSLIGARHPLLGDRAVPVTIKCGEGFRSLVITGPNTGGKTVVLKTAGICVFLGWCGLPVPAEEDSAIGNVSSIFADIGDEQSIEQNLSTFSAHVRNIISILEKADRTSLVLLDELGAGTDPQEGAALGIAILDMLTRTKGLTLATTHHNPVKQYALTAPGVETASMEFDAETLSPTFRLLMGIPGKSNALLIAQKYGMPEHILGKARKVLSEREIPVEDLIAELNERKAFLDKEEEEIAEMRKSLSAERESFREKSRELEFRKDKILAEVEARASEILEKAEESSRALLRGLDDASRSVVHREISGKSEEIRSERRSLEQRREKRLLRSASGGEDFVPQVGATVQIAGTDFVGVIESLKGNRAILTVGAVKMEVASDRLAATDKKPRGPAASREKTPSPPETVPSSIMVRGMNVQDALPLVERYLDQAMRIGYSSVTVIHGRGEGILRREVHSLCASLKYVASYRLGEASEGGYGVTVVTFRR